MASNLPGRLLLLSDKFFNHTLNSDELSEYKSLIELTNAMMRIHRFKHQKKLK